VKKLQGYAYLSVATALFTMALKLAAYQVTASVALLSDAIESSVNLCAALLALTMLRWSAQPPDEEHRFGHEKGEYLSSGVEGALVLVAALGIFLAALRRFLEPVPIHEVGLGLGLNALATLANSVSASILLRAGRRHRSVALQADAQHLFSDVHSSLAVFVGVLLASWSGRAWMDPAVATLAGVWVGYQGWQILRTAGQGLLDASVPAAVLEKIELTLQAYRERGLQFHALRTRQAGRTCFVQFHALVPGGWTVLRAHRLVERIEAELGRAVPAARVIIHIEPMEDDASFRDEDFPELL